MDAGAMEKLRLDGYEVVEQFYEPDQLGAALRDFDIVVIRSATKIKEPQIDAAKDSRLKLIIRAGVGVDNIAVKYAEAAGIQVKNTPRASSNAVAELAIALLFAMLKLKPTAFCILDEIETSLDEVNVSNFAEYVKRYSEDTQFILITHRKGSMEVCNALYGVAMEEKGISKIVSARFNESA